MEKNAKRNIIVVAALLPVLVIGFFVFHHTKEPSSAMSAQATSFTSNVGMYTNFKDGTYTTTGTYQSPGGPDALDVTLTIANNVVTDTLIVEKPGDPISQRWQDKFASGYKAQVVGRNLADLNRTNVSGSSLTPKGFDDALNQIRSQAAAV